MIRTWTPECDTPNPPGAVDYRTVKAWFQQCRTLAAEVEAQRQKVRRIRGAAGSCTQRLNGMPTGGGSGDRIADTVEKLDTERRKLQRMETDLCNLRIEATRRAYSLATNPEFAAAICEFYVNCKKQETIAQEAGVADRTVIHSRINRGCRMLAEIWCEFA